jgi:hypothetical protein
VPDGSGTGRMTWAGAVAGPLAGATCLWQDLDGLHVEAAPATAPLTSIVWGWRDDLLIRVRLDGETAFVAVHEPGQMTRVVPWDPGDGRIAAVRGPGASRVGEEFEQVVVEPGADGFGPVTFIRPVRR